MRCQDCNTNLSDEESTRKDEVSGKYLDLCNTCLSNFYKDINGDNPFDLLDCDNNLDKCEVIFEEHNGS